MARRVYGLFLVLIPFAFMFGFGSGSPAPAGRGLDTPRRPDPALVEELDAAVQERFRILTEEDLAHGFFGMERMIDPRKVHSLMPVADEQVTGLPVQKLSRSGWRTAFFLAEQAPHRPDGVGMILGPTVTEPAPWDPCLDPDFLSPVASRVFAERRAVRARPAGVVVEGRPIPASSAQCLHCHPGKRLGDPIGVILYAFGPKPPSDALGRAR